MFLLIGLQRLLEAGGQLVWKPQQPVQKMKQPQNMVARHPALIQAADQRPFPLQAPFRVVARLLRLQMRHHHRGKRVGARFERVPRQIVQEFDAARAEGECHLLHHGCRKFRGTPAYGLIGRDRQALNGQVVAVIHAVGGDAHAIGEAGLVLALDLDVDEQPGLLPALLPDLDQLVNISAGEPSIAGNLLQFCIQEGIPSFPGNIGIGSREEKGHKRHELVFQDLLPWTIIIVFSIQLTRVREPRS